MQKKRKTVKSKVNKLLTNKTPLLLTVILILAGIYGGYFLGKNSYNHDKRYELVSRKQLESERKTITAKFRDTNSDICNTSSDAVKPKDRAKVFDKYLRVNKYGNRAVIRGCYYDDALLYKGIDGEWHQMSVNMSLDTRANIYWQKECLIDDITRTDNAFRPENTSIDVDNYLQCEILQRNEAIYQILSRAGEHPTQQDINAYVSGGSDILQ